MSQNKPSSSGYDLRPLSASERTALAQSLTAEERHVILNQGTERAFCGTLLNNKDSGLYACRLCGLPLFKADNKFESGTGWPSFYQGFDDAHILEIVDKARNPREQRLVLEALHRLTDAQLPGGMRDVGRRHF